MAFLADVSPAVVFVLLLRELLTLSHVGLTTSTPAGQVVRVESFDF